MKNKRIFALLSITVIFVFITSLFTTVNVLADDTTPPTEVPVATEEPVVATEEPVATGEPIAATEEPVATEPASTVEPEAETPAEILGSTPEGVDVVVLDENGDAMPLTTEEAAQIIMTGDPMWCPDGDTPGTDALDSIIECTPSYADFASLITDLTDGGYSGNGTIYVAYDYVDAEGDIILNHSDGSLTGLGNLVIQGGWDFDTLSANYNTVVGSTNLGNNSLDIYNWVGNVTVNNVFSANSDFGIYIDTDGNVTLDQVSIDNSDVEGAAIYSGGNVSITDSEFTNSGGYVYSDSGVDYDYFIYSGAAGLYVEADGDITLTDVLAEDNEGDGARLYGQNVMVTDSSFINNGWGDDGYGAYQNYRETLNDWVGYDYYDLAELAGGAGLYVGSDGDITLQNVEAYYNAGDGADLYADGDVTVTESYFGNNGYFGNTYAYNLLNIYDVDAFTNTIAEFNLSYQSGVGLHVEADGTVTLSDVLLEENAGDGAVIESGENVVINGVDSVFNGWDSGYFGWSFCDVGNCGYDLLEYMLIDNGSGTAYCQNVVSEGLPSEYLAFDPCDYYYTLLVQGSNFNMRVNSAIRETEDSASNQYSIYQNGGSGLSAYADGSIALEDVFFLENAGDGAQLEGDGAVSVMDAGFFDNGGSGYMQVGEGFSSDPSYISTGGTVEFSYGDGLNIWSDSDITLAEVSSVWNANNGAALYANGSIFVEDSCFCENGAPVYIGGEGGLFGYFLYETLGLDETIELPVSAFYLSGGFSESPTDYRSDFDLYFTSGSGIIGNADNNITLLDVEASGNMGYGADMSLDGSFSATNAEFDDNGYGFNGGLYSSMYDSDVNDNDYIEEAVFFSNGSGLYVSADNSVTLNNVYSEGNALYGAELYGRTVFVQDSWFYSNGYGGGRLEGYHYENGLGAYDDEYEETDGGSGLYVSADGNITLINVDASGNYINGAETYSDGGRVIVSCGYYDNNGAYGIYEDGASSLELYGPEVLNNGNSPDEYFFSGSLVLSDDCTIPVDETKPAGGAVFAACEGTAETATFLLPNGDFVIFPCPINDFAFVQPLSEKELPGPLADGQKYLSALVTHLMRDNQGVEELEQPGIISFLIPDGVEKDALSILFWNGSEWNDLGGEVSEDGLHFEVSTKLVGTFVLISK